MTWRFRAGAIHSLRCSDPCLDPLPALSAPAALGPPVRPLWHLTGGPVWRGESTFPFGMQSTDWPLFCTKPCASRIPRRAERLGSILDAASGEFRPQPHTTCTLSRLSSILKRRPLVLRPCQRLPAEPAVAPARLWTEKHPSSLAVPSGAKKPSLASWKGTAP